MPEAHNRHFARFGSFIRSDGSVNLATVSYGNDIYANSITNSNYYIGNLTKTVNYNDIYATVTQEIDLTVASGNYKFTAVYPNNSGDIVTKTVTNTANQLAIKGLAWAIMKNTNNNYNGRDDASLVSTYRIDNIKVMGEGIEITDSSISPDSIIPVDEKAELTFDLALAGDFKDYIDLYKNGEKVDSSKYTISASDDKKKVTVSGFDYNSAYMLEVKKDIRSAEGYMMATDWQLEFKTESIVSHGIVKERYEQGFVPTVTPLGGISYEYAISKDEAPFEDYDFSALDETGKYKLKVTATDGNGKTQTEIIPFEIIGPIAPEAKNVSIKYSGAIKEGLELKGAYTYFDSNDNADENMDRCDYRWYRSDSENGVFEPIDGATGISYTLTADDEDKYIKFGVKPYSKVEPKEGEEYLSKAFLSFMNPTASNITISGIMAVDEQLTVNYDYSDLNGDAEITSGENATSIIWYTSDSAGGAYSEVGKGKNYTVKISDINKWFKVGVIPENNGAGSGSKEFYSEETAGAFAPVASDVRLTGNANVGSRISVDYKYYDANGDPESDSVIEWYVGGARVSESPYYTISEKDTGKTVYATVTPYTTQKPVAGTPAQSDVKKVSGNSNTVRSGGGGSGGGSGSRGGSVSGGGVSTPSGSGNQGSGEGNTAERKSFKDISGHWAEQAILKMVEQGIILGKTADEFDPEGKITRAEFAALIQRMFKLPDGEYEFGDVKDGDWYKGCVSAVASAGYMVGFEGKFRPTAKITREEMAVVLAAIASANGIEPDESTASFNDIEEISDWAKSAVDFMAGIGIIKGTDDNCFIPKGEATRAQTVIMLTRLRDVLSAGN